MTRKGRKMFALLAAAMGIASAQAADLDDYFLPVRPVGVNGQPAWNDRSVFFMYPPAFGFTNLVGASCYRFTVKDETATVRTFLAESPNESLASVWANLPRSGWVDVTCEALDAQGAVLAPVGFRSFWKQAPYTPGAYPVPARSPAEAARLIARYVRNLPIVRANYLGDRRVPDEMVDAGSQVFVSYPAKMGAAVLSAMAKLSVGESGEAKDARRLADGVFEKLQSLTEPEGRPLAGFPRTYEAHPALRGHPLDMVTRHGGKVMMIYPREVAEAYLDFYEVTGNPVHLDAAVRIADRYIALQGEDGTWPLNVCMEDGTAVESNRLVPAGMLDFFERVHALTGDERYRIAADRAFAYVERGPLATWNWEGQFEDVKPSAPYWNLTKHDACVTAMYLARRFPADARRLAQAREIVRFAEDQFVCWERPMHGKRDPRCRMGVWGCESWRCPAVLEQYDCYVPIDASAAKMIRTYLALYRATKNPLDLAKARTLGDAIIRETRDDGYLPTFWFDFREDWPNCMLASASALTELAAVQSEEDRRGFSAVEQSRAAVAAGAGDFTVELPAEHAGPLLHAEDFGVSETNEFNGAALTAAFRAARACGAKALYVRPGTYRCFDDAGVLAEGLTNFTFNAQGALFVFRRPSLVGTEANMTVRRCDHVLFRGFRMDWDWESDPLATLGTVVAKHEDGQDDASYFDIKVDRVPPGYPDSVPIQTMTTIDTERRHLIGTKPNRLFGGLYEGHFGIRNKWVGPDILRVWPSVRPGGGHRIVPGCEWAYNTYLNRETVCTMPVGVSYRILHYYYGKGGIQMTSNTHLTLKDVEIWSCRGFGIGVDGDQQYWRVENFRLEPPADKLASRMLSSTADGHHVIRSAGYCQYVDCLISFCNDDASNFHDCTSYGVPEGADGLRQTFVHGVTYLGAKVGDEIELAEANYAKTGWKGRVVEIAEGGKLLKMDRPVPQSPLYGRYLFYNRTYSTRHIYINNLTCRDAHFRNLWQSGDLTLENCTFERMGAGQCFLADWTKDLWCEGVGVENVVIRRCRFIDNHQQERGSDGRPAEICSYLSWPGEVQCPPPPPGFFKDFLVEDCVFENPVGPILDMRYVDGLVFRRNRLYREGKRVPLTADLLKIVSCTNVSCSADVPTGAE